MEADSEFKEISEPYGNPSDTNKKELYDRYGWDGILKDNNIDNSNWNGNVFHDHDELFAGIHGAHHQMFFVTGSRGKGNIHLFFLLYLIDLKTWTKYIFASHV